MVSYTFKGASNDADFQTFYATHPAQPDTWLVFVASDGHPFRFPVLFWGLLADGSPIPITMDGPWDGSPNEERLFVELPNGHCVKFEGHWNTFKEAYEHFRPTRPAPLPQPANSEGAR